MSPGEPVTGLILSGGGARAAYQVGVLAAIAELLPAGASNPFPVIVGTSAGAVNAVSLASGALDFSAAVRRLTEFWQGFRSHQVLRSDWPGVIRQASRFVSHSLLGIGAKVPVALLNSSPLRHLLEHKLDLRGIDQAIAVALKQTGLVAAQAEHLVAVHRLQDSPQRLGVKTVRHHRHVRQDSRQHKHPKHTAAAQDGQAI